MIWQSSILIVELVLCALFAFFVYWQLGSFRHRPWYVTVLTLFGWICCFYIVFLVANDVAQASQCPAEKVANESDQENICPDERVVVPEDALYIIWQVVYWVTLFLTWGVYPILQTYSMTGEFTFGDKMRTSIRSNLLLYSVMAAVLIVVGIVSIIVLELSLNTIPATMVAAANAYGLFLLIAMLGHGLVNVPRRLWRASRRSLNLRRHQFDVAALDAKLQECKESLTKTLRKVRKASELTLETDSYRKYIDVIISKCPEQFNSIPYGEGNIEISYPKLALLHERVMREDHLLKMYTSMFNHAVTQALKLEDVSASKKNGLWRIEWVNKPPRTHQFATLFNVTEYLWYCYIQDRVLQLMCGVAVLLSIAIVWSELLFFLNNITIDNHSFHIDVSIFSLYIHALSTHSLIILQLSIFLPVVYIAWCSYSSLFKLRLFNYYHIVPHHMSDSNSLLFSAAYLCRLTAPLAYNFMQMSNYKNTAFVQVMGTMDLSDLGSDYFQMFFPVLILPFILMTLFDVYTRIMNLLHIKRFQFTDDFNHSLIEDGQHILNEHRDELTRKPSTLIGKTSTSNASEVTGGSSRGIQFKESGIRANASTSIKQNPTPPVSRRSAEIISPAAAVADEQSSISTRIKSNLSKIFGGGSPKTEPAAPSRSTVGSLPKGRSANTTFNLIEEEDDNVWNDFNDKIHPL